MAYEPKIDRAKLLSGPAHIIINKTGDEAAWKYCWCKGPVTVNVKPVFKDVEVAGYGIIDKVKVDENIEIDFTPSGNFDASMLAFLYNSVLSKRIGSQLFDVTDTPVWVHSLDGKLLAVTCAKVTQLPTLMMGVPNQRLEGGAKLTGIVGNNMARSTANALFTPIATLAFGRQPLPSQWQHKPVKATWAGLQDGGSPAADIEIATKSGWKVMVQLQIEPEPEANLGTVTYKIKSVGLQASCVPLNLTEVELMHDKVIGSDRRLGTSITGSALTLAEDYGGITVILNGAEMTDHPIIYDDTAPRAGECFWTAFRDFSAGTASDIGSIVMTANPEA